MLTPAGPIPIEKLKDGDGVVSLAAGKAGFGKVLARMEVQSEEIREIALPGVNLRITPTTYPISLWSSLWSRTL